MFANNQNLKPKTDEFNSRPWMWPIAYRVSAELHNQYQPLKVLHQPYLFIYHFIYLHYSLIKNTEGNVQIRPCGTSSSQASLCLQNSYIHN